RWIYIGRQSLWLDELFSVFLVRKNWWEIIQGTAQDILPPLYYLLLKIMMQFGEDATAARALSAIASTVTVPVVFYFGKRLVDRKFAWVAAGLLAVNPFHVVYAQEARMYSLFGLFFLLSAYFFWQAWHDSSRKSWGFFTLFTILSFYTHSLAFLNLLALDLFVFTQRATLKKQWRSWLAAHLLIGVTFLPWAVVILQQTARLGGEFAGRGQSPVTLLTSMYLFLLGTAVPPMVTAVSLFATLTLLAFALLATIYRRISKPDVLLFIFLMYAVPVLGLFIISFQSPIFVERRLLPATFGLYFFLAWVITAVNPRRLNQLLGVVLGLSMVASLPGYYLEPQKIPMHEVARFVSEQFEAGDTIIHVTDTSALAFAFYEPQLPNHFLAGDPDYLAQTNRGRAQRIAGLIPEAPDKIVVDQKRLWLIVTLDHQIEYQQQRVDQFEAQYQQIDHQNVGGVDLILYLLAN
ncbi:MAG: glycosyltransferase family 39 protein, partial [Anaerolineales bacterium]|nr:glycosyltransferase family 39 protein [Anaerolineales bacterium]